MWLSSSLDEELQRHRCWRHVVLFRPVRTRVEAGACAAAPYIGPPQWRAMASLGSLPCATRGGFGVAAFVSLGTR